MCREAVKRSCSILGSLFLATLLILAGCGGRDHLSTEVVSGVAAAGAPMAGEVRLKDSSILQRERVALTASDGSFAFDVTGLTPPFILQAIGSADGSEYRLHSWAEGAGTANINPLSDVVVALAAGVSDPSQAYQSEEARARIAGNLASSLQMVSTTLQPLLARYGAQGRNPITAPFAANHLELDEMFDSVKISVVAGTLSIVNKGSGGAIYSGSLANMGNGELHAEQIPPPPGFPTAPSALSATGGAGQVSLTWSAVGNATSYQVYYATSAGVTKASGTRIAAASNSLLHSGLTPDTTYYYVVTAVNSSGESAASPEVHAVTAPAPPAPTPPAAPTAVTAAGGTRQVTVSWNPVAGATSYNIYWSNSSGVTSASGTKLTGATTPAVHAQLSDGTTYYYIVTALNGAGESAASAQVAAATLPAVPAETVPAAVTGLSAVGAANRVTLSWSPVAGASSYHIYWSATPGVTTATGTRISGATSPFVQSGLAAGVSYYYLVTAVNGAGEGAASAQATARTDPPPPAIPAAPTGVSASGSDNQVSVTWSAVPGATSYNLYWSAAPGVSTATGIKVTSVTSPFVQTGLAAGASFYYLVTALNSAGEGPASAQVTASTNLAIPATPGAVSAAGGANQVTLSWPAVAGAATYNLYWSPIPDVDPATGIKVASVASPHLHTGLSAGTSYYYLVTALNGAGESAASAQVTATTDAPPIGVPVRPGGVSVSAGRNQATLFWPSVANASSYNIYYSTSPGVTTENGTKVANATAPQTVTGLADSTSYYFLLTAQNGSGEGIPSARLSATTFDPPVIVLDGLTLYNQICFLCHGDAKRGRSAAQIQNAINTIGSMQFLRNELSAEQIAAIASATSSGP